MGMPEATDELRSRAEKDNVEFFFAMFVDMHGKPCAKLVPAEALDVLMSGGAGFAGFAAGAMGQSPADPDLVAVPDPASYALAPWQPGLAVLQCDVHVEGAPWPYSPRLILKEVLELAKSRGFVYQVGCEAEYFLLRRTAEGQLLVADQADCLELPCYDAKALTRMYDHVTTVSKYMNQLGWANYANDHEDANGQFEQNFRYADALTTADRVVFFRYMVHTLAQRAGMTATFMPKPFAHLTGNGLHMHSSLWDEATGSELFVDPTDARGLGLSETAYHFIGGLLDHATSLAAITCPSVNSYKRMGVGVPLSGATWAPAYVSYGGNNRTQMLRVADGASVENRACDGAANPYLAMAAQLAAGLDGVERRADPGEPNRDNLYELPPEQLARRGIRSLPPTLLHAIEELTVDDVLRQALGKTPDGDYIDYYAAVKRREFLSWHALVSGSEVDRYLTLF
jgi:glutamine synthetase